MNLIREHLISIGHQISDFVESLGSRPSASELRKRQLQRASDKKARIEKYQKNVSHIQTITSARDWSMIKRKLNICVWSTLIIMLIFVGFSIKNNIDKNEEVEEIISSIESAISIGELELSEDRIHYALVNSAHLNLEQEPTFNKLQDDVAHLREKQRETRIKDILKVIHDLSGSAREKAVIDLMSLDPKNKEFANEFEKYTKERHDLENDYREREARRLHTKSRQERLESGFSPWSGAHRKLEYAIKKSMHNPDSYDHVETKFWDMKDHLIVLTRYRGTNAFGGIVLSSVKAKVSIDGDLIEIVETDN